MDGFSVKTAQQFRQTGSLDSGTSSSGSIERGIRTSGEVFAPAEAGKSFADTLKDAVDNVNELQKTADKSMQNLAAGRTDNVAEVMIATEKADIGMRLMMQVRNKIIDAYQEIMKMQV